MENSESKTKEKKMMPLKTTNKSISMTKTLIYKKKEKSILTVSVIAALLAIVCKYLLTFISGGFAVIICAVAASLIGALLFPRKE